MVGWRVMCVAGVVLAGCGEEQPLLGGASVDEQGRIWSSAGSRLRPRVLRSAAGLAVPYDVYDSKLEVPCQPTPLEDGSIRCLPDVPSALLNMFFQDAACTQPLASTSAKPDLPPGTLVAEIDKEDCLGKKVRLARLTGPVAPGTPIFFRANEGDPCEPPNYLTYPGKYTVDEVTDSPVVLTPRRLSMDGRIAARVLVGGDGSHIVTGELHDTAMDAPVLGDETGRLLPTRVRWVETLRRDTPPTDPEEYPAWCRAHGDFLRYNRCDITASLTHVALVDESLPYEPEPTPSVFKVKHVEAAATRCTAAHGVYYDVHPLPKQPGALLDGAVPMDRWVHADRAAAMSDGRLARMEADRMDRAFTVGGRLAVRPRGPRTSFLDMQLGGLRCRPTPVADGSMRCLPESNVPPFSVAQVVYLDEGCTELAALGVAGTEGRPRYVILPFAVQPDYSLAPTRVFPVADPLPNSTIFGPDHNSGACTMFQLNPGSQVFRVGAELPPETFAPLTVEFR
jgi:hypothetical protein